jgi:RNA polymerase sigma-70 factor (ECF subfamily)
VLTKTFGSANLALAEDVVQDTLLKALELWKLKGVPENPSAWLLTVARNKALDIIRSERKHHSFAAQLAPLLKSEYTASCTLQDFISEKNITDDQLRMMFVCCHPSLSEEAQVALILKTLCGFSTAEIASAFLTHEETITKRLFRTREKLREEKVAFEIPDEVVLEKRLDNVLTAIYLLFNEGYHATNNTSLIRDDLVEEALRLGQLLATHSRTRASSTLALLALMCFQSARLYGRVDSIGTFITLKDQDRSQWNQELIQQGISFLKEASQGTVLTAYHLEAAIAYEHCIANAFQATNWENIDTLYEQLVSIRSGALILFQHAIIKAERFGSQVGLQHIAALEEDSSMSSNHFFFTAKGNWLYQLNRMDEALACYQKAFSLVCTPSEKSFLQVKIDAVTKSTLMSG